MISLDALNSGTYQYNFDAFGTREVEDGHFDLSSWNDYLNRPNIFDFTKKENKFFHFGNEVRAWAEINATFLAERDVPDAATADKGIVFPIPEEAGAADGASQPAESVAVIFAQALMIKERLDPSYIKGVIVSTPRMRDELLNTLRGHGLVSSTNGVETIMDIPIKKFIRVGDHLSNSMLK